MIASIGVFAWIDARNKCCTLTTIHAWNIICRSSTTIRRLLTIRMCSQMRSSIALNSISLPQCVSIMICKRNMDWWRKRTSSTAYEAMTTISHDTVWTCAIKIDCNFEHLNLFASLFYSFVSIDIYDIVFVALCVGLLTVIVLSTLYDLYLKRRNLPHMCNREHYMRPVDRGRKCSSNFLWIAAAGKAKLFWFVAQVRNTSCTHSGNISNRIIHCSINLMQICSN